MIIEPKHFEYLVIQHGRVSDERHSFAKWKAAYLASLDSIFESFRSVLPERVGSMLDIGSGLGGIDVLLSRHYDHPRIYLLDGLDDPPEVKSHHKTFSDSNVMLDFQRKNGTLYPCHTDVVPGTKLDLVVSFSAFAFHIPPTTYIDDLKASTHDKTRLIFDVRRTKEEWLAQLIHAFGVPTVLLRENKSVRVAFRA